LLFLHLYIKELKLIIEFDEEHHNMKWCKEKDKQKDQDLTDAGYHVLRIKKLDWIENPIQIINQFQQLVKELECQIKKN
jgi:very-short-patch-repair endonuclease